MFLPDSLNLKNNKNGKIAYQAGIEFSYAIFNHFRIGIGGVYTTLSWEELYVPEPEDYYLIDFSIDVQYHYRLMEFPLYLQYEPIIDKKFTPYIRIGGSVTKVNASTAKLLGTDPPGNEQNYYAQIFNYTFKDDMLFVRDMHAVFLNIGINYKITNSFFVGINAGIKRYFYYSFNDKRSNYVTCGNITASYRF